MHLQAYKGSFAPLKTEGEFSVFMRRFWRLEVNFVFRVSGASGVEFGNRKRHWKAGLESNLMTEVRIACVQVQFD